MKRQINMYGVIDDTGNLFLIDGTLSLFRTKEEAEAECNYMEKVVDARIYYSE